MKLAIAKDGGRIDLPSDQTEKIKSCCELINSELSFSDHTEGEKVFAVESTAFDLSTIKDAFEFLAAHQYHAPVYGRVFSNNVAEHVAGEHDLALAKKYDTIEKIARLRACASYFQIKSLTAFCNILICCMFRVEPTNPESLNEVKKKFGITSNYTPAVEAEYKQKYPFLN